jgi:hypothetical protein
MEISLDKAKQSDVMITSHKSLMSYEASRIKDLRFEVFVPKVIPRDQFF